MAQKTKAAMRGRQCSTENKEQNQHTRPVAGGQSVSTMYFCILGTAPMAQLNHNMLISKQSSNLSLAALVSSKIVGCVLITRQLGGTALQHTQYFPQWGECEPVAGALILRTSFRVAQMQLSTYPQLWGNLNIECRGQRNFATAVFTHDFVDLAYTKNVGQTPDLAFAQIFGSIPSFFNFSRQASFTHELNWPEPAASLICSSSSSSNRMFLAVLLERSKSRLGFFSCIGIYQSCRVNIDGIYHLLLKQVLKTAKPGSALTLTGPLTKPLIGVTVMADKQHTQTRPEFTWRFISASERYSTAKPLVIYVNASSEQEASETMPGVNLIFAARLPFHDFRVVEVCHA